jgi:hypothetical protein
MIPLDRREMYTHLQHVMTKDRLAGPDEARKLRFPTALSSNISVFSILKTVYHLEMASLALRPRYTSVILPVGAPRNPEEIPTYQSIHMNPDFSVQINASGQYICFHGWNSVTIFELLANGKHCKLSSLASLEDSKVLQIFCFHESLPLLAFVRGTSIKLWNYKRGRWISTLSVSKGCEC